MNRETKVIGFAHQKGGVGKSVMCNLIAHEFAKAGKAVALIDSDPQASIFCAYRERSMAGSPVTIPVLHLTGYASICEFMELNEGIYDYVFIDTAGALSAGEKKIILSCHYVIIPITASDSDWNSLVTFGGVLKEITDSDQKLIGILNKYKPNTTRWKEFMLEINSVLSDNNIKLLPAALRDREDYTFIPMVPISDLKATKAAKEEVNYLINKLLKEIE